MTIWFDEAALQGWRRNERAGQVGHPTTYADATITCALTLKAVYHLKLRQTEGFVSSLLQLLGVDLPVPDYSTLSRRAAGLQVALPRRTRDEPIHVVVDASGVKVFGFSNGRCGSTAGASTAPGARCTWGWMKRVARSSRRS